ncbi:MAG: 2-iminobutanoate/2-iminopropanoate deaminase [Syntrophus sp. SKADARSKE-3]|nr:2-iminobutanoate/2-iminopropanoate deaminase [Syntrophus sp. SKADARSKE-3]
MNKRILAVDAVPAVGPYSQAVEAGGFVFCSGQVPIVPETGVVITGNIGEATEQALKNVRAVLAAAGVGLEQVIKTTIYLTDISDFPAVNEVYGRYFQKDHPARSTVAVAALPKGAAVEIEAVAVGPDNP